MAEQLINKTPMQISQRWRQVLDPNLRKGSWTVDEDQKIVQWVAQKGSQKWNEFAETILTNRSGKQCRERWWNHLREEANQGPWTEWEDNVIIGKRNEMGNKWAAIALQLPGRTENDVKNRWYSTLSKRIARSDLGIPLVFKRGPKKRLLDPVGIEPPPLTGRIPLHLDYLSPNIAHPCDELFEKDFLQPWNSVFLDESMSPIQLRSPRHDEE
jgi:hypothetical protein